MKARSKNDFRQKIARVVEISQKESQAILEAILDGMVRALRNGERIELWIRKLQHMGGARGEGGIPVLAFRWGTSKAIR